MPGCVTSITITSGLVQSCHGVTFTPGVVPFAGTDGALTSDAGNTGIPLNLPNFSYDGSTRRLSVGFLTLTGGLGLLGSRPLLRSDAGAVSTGQIQLDSIDHTTGILPINRGGTDAGTGIAATANLIQDSDNASAPNNSLYFSTDSSKLAYKDSGGTSHVLY